MSANRKQIVLAFATLGLEKAEQIAQRIQVTVQKVQGAAREAAREIKGRTREAMKEMRALKNAAIERERIEKSAAAFKARGQEQFIRGLGQVNNVRERVENVASVASGNLAGLTSLLRAVPGGPVMAAVSAIALPLLQQVQQRLEERQQQVLSNMRLELQLELDKLRLELDYTRKLEEVPGFALDQAKKAFQMATWDARAVAANGWHEAADFLDSFEGD